MLTRSLIAAVVTLGVLGPVAIAGTPARDTAPVTVYLRRGGGTLQAGWDDSSRDISSLASRTDDGEVTIPAWRGGDRRWRAVTACVVERFGPFAIDVVTERPARGDYIMVMVGGRSSLLGYPRHVSGVSPFTGDVMPGGVSFVFSENLRNDVEGTCTSILHEAGHALGLDHAYLCEDPMSYLYGCGEKTFQDQDAACGEDEPRACNTDDGTQNSYRHLARVVGLRKGRPQAADPAPERDLEPVDPYRSDDAERAPTRPTITLSTGSLSSSNLLTFTARASSPAGVADVVLLWVTPDDRYAWPCSEIPDGVPASCTRKGDTFTFRLRVGTGERAVAAVAIDNDGGYTTSDSRTLTITASGDD